MFTPVNPSFAIPGQNRVARGINYTGVLICCIYLKYELWSLLKIAVSRALLIFQKRFPNNVGS